MAEILKIYTPKESNLVYEWVKKYYPKALQFRRVRMGELPTVANSSLYGVLRRWADLIFKSGDTVYIVEAKIRPEPGAISQLELYDSLFTKTPEFSEWKELPRKLIFLTTVMDPAVKAIADLHKVDYVVYSPDWIKKYWLDIKTKAVKNGNKNQ